MSPEHARPQVTVLGSINVDLVVGVPRLPRPGETVLGGTFAQHMGGKGANQAVAAARAGARVVMVGAVGTDANGDASLAALARDDVEVSHVRRAQDPTGVALIALAPDGENQIAVAPGANVTLHARDVPEDALRSSQVLLASLEVPVAVVTAAMRSAADLGLRCVLNPAPAQPLPDDLLALHAVLTPNREEALVLAGLDDLDAAVERLAVHGPLIVTLGSEGALVVENGVRTPIPGHRVERVTDATGAGDTFAGVLAAWLAGGSELLAAAKAANAAAALSVQEAGARGGMPRAEQIRAALSAGA